MTVSAPLLSAMFDEETIDGLLVLLTIDHASLSTPIRVVNNMTDVHRHNDTDSASDQTTNGNTAILAGAPTYVTGINTSAAGRALSLDSTQSAALGFGAEFDLTSFTVEFWIKPTTLQGTTGYGSNVVLAREAVGTKGYRLGYNVNGRVQFWTTDDGGTLTLNSGTNILSAGTAVHLAITYDLATTTARMVLNGATIASATGTVIVPDGATLTLNGTWAGATRSDAVYDEVRVWSIARSDEVIRRDLDRRLLGSETSLVGYWPWSGHDEFIGYPFEIVLPTDAAGSPPSAQLTIDNVSREIVAAIRTATGTPPSVQIEVVRLLDQNSAELSFPTLNLRNARATVGQVTGDLFSEDLQTEPYPADNFTPGAFPGLF